jgi:hypothetical protein
MDKRQRKALEVKAKKKIKTIMRQYPLFRDTAITITFKSNTNTTHYGT